MSLIESFNLLRQWSVVLVTGDMKHVTSLEETIDFFQNTAQYVGRNPNWVPGTPTDDNSIPEPYYKLGYGQFGRFSMTVSPGKGYNLSVHQGPTGMGTIAKGTGKTLQEALDNLYIDYARYFKRYLPRLPEI